MTQAEIKQILAAHAEWLADNSKGTGANLSDANLRGRTSYADLSVADLSYADLRGANLSDADLSYADLRGANLSGANLSYADLRGANLIGADLRGANLRGANLSEAVYSVFSLVPEQGEFTAFKKLKGGAIAELLIPADAKRTSSLVGRKCRASKAIVIAIDNGKEGVSSHDRTFVYKVGETVSVDNFDDDIRVECTTGIHFFITRREAEEY